jgi:NhaP-type Na+/H+ or K+/H+ antiporter
MDAENTLVGIALVILGYGYFSKLLAKWNISGPMIFTFVGMLLSPLVLGSYPFKIDAEAVHIVAQIALILELFSDASGIKLSHLRKNRQWTLPARLLFVAMPISIVLSILVAKVFFPQEPNLFIVLLALILAPTDAALGKAVVTDKRIAEKVRNTINVESGLNDGIVFPVFLAVVVMIATGEGGEGGGFGYVAQQIVVGATAGGIVGYIGAKAGNFSMEHKWMKSAYRDLIPIALAVFAYYVAEPLGGNGYIAAFFGGLILGNTSEAMREDVEHFTESEGEFLIMVSFLVFGLVLVPATIMHWDVKAFVFAVLSLTLLRMLPVVISFGFIKMDFSTRLFIGWFGPRGIASILYILVAVEQIGDISAQKPIFAVMTLTIFLSIILHGLSAQPLAVRYSRSHSADEEKVK